ncbi:MAG: TldD/PmbA family protein [candidate division Zixibacteria bacterium]|nr:TldD/PmbA family protein [candidate division Zixibacteria bacterium]
MIGKKKLLATLNKVLGKSKADETEIVFSGNESGLTRYANSEIHQNVFEKNSKILFKSVIGKKIGVASTNSLVMSDLIKTMNDSFEIAVNQPENPGYPGLAGPAKYKTINTYNEKTAKFTPNDRAKIVKKMIAISDKKKFDLAGAFSTSSGELAVVNSKGVKAYQKFTTATVNLIAMSDTSSGYAAGTARKVSDLNFVKLANRAVEKCDVSQNPISIEPGTYEVILEPEAFAALLEWMNYIGFGSKAFDQKTSFLAGKVGKKVTSEMITIVDDALDTTSIAFPFDFEGVPKKRVPIIQKGVVKGVVYDRMAGKKAKRKSTGHGLTPDQSNEGAIPLNLVISGGKAKRDKMIEKVKKGILITRFHYINGFIDTPNAVLTGMTRDGTFLIKNGKIVGGIKNLRFTDRMLDSFKTAVAVSKERDLVASWWSAVGCTKAPTIHLKKFKFTGKTEF